MFGNHLKSAARSARHTIAFSAPQSISNSRTLATVSPVNPISRSHKVVVIGAGSGGLAISHQLLRSGKFRPQDIAIIDPATWHHYQPGWTLVGGGLKTKEELRSSLHSLVDPKLKFYNEGVGAFSPEENFVTLAGGDKVGYEHLVVCPGIHIDYTSIKGLSEALADPKSLVSSTYGYDTCDKVFPTVKKLSSGNAIFSQPAGVIKCAGAPQKIMWLALDHWRRAGLYNPSDASKSPIKISFATGLPVMFGVPRYSVELDRLRIERGVEGLFQHDLISIDGNTATFAQPDGKSQVTRKFDFPARRPENGTPRLRQEQLARQRSRLRRRQ